MPIVIVAVALLGLAVGSFLNVVIYRVPSRQSLVTPASHCPSCQHPIRNRHNVPVFGWLLLRGRCADCRARISIRYPLVELITCLLFVAVALQLNHLHTLAALPAYLYFSAMGIALALIDFDVHRLPNSIVLPSYPILALALTLAAVFDDRPEALVRAGIGGMALFILYFSMAFAYPAGMGLGDVKLAGIVGAMTGYLSLSALLVGAFSAFLIGGLFGALAMASGRASRKAHIPFGPFMILGAFIALFAGSPLVHFYNSLAFGT
ncbi:MAG TPA: prepilin peptidase [Jatrophihabitans sp.]|jgi:leader peptidase (prepilin peptidase)/N-methyltransferase